MTYDVSEIFGNTIQGEGMHAGMPCSFIRFSGCNLWPSPDKPSVTCPWCDTPQLHRKNPMSLDKILEALSFESGEGHGLVISGGEPLLQVDDDLLTALCTRFPWIDIETNGTVPVKYVDSYNNVYLSCSPKVEHVCKIKPDWFKVVIPAKTNALVMIQARYPHTPVFLQPQDPDGSGDIFNNEEYDRNVRMCVSLALKNVYRISLQMHKMLHLR